jgi:diguanylate cyclase (GGDEF)-like protein/PAS domain S-box-containing protein
MALTTAYSQERRIEERRKDVKSLGNALRDIMAAANSGIPSDELMHSFLAESAKAMECSSALIVFRENAFLKSRYQYEMSETPGKAWTSEELPHAVLAEITRKPVLIEDTQRDERVNRTVMEAYEIGSVLAVPLPARNRVIGIVLYHNSVPNAFTHEQVEFSTRAGSIAALAFDDRQVREKADQQEKRLETLTRLGESLNRTNVTIHSLRKPQEIMQRVIVEGTQAIEAESAMIFMEEDGLWRVDNVHNLPQDLIGRKYTREEVLHTAIAAETREPVLIVDVDQDPRIHKRFAEDLKIRSLIDFPLLIREKTVGDIVFHYHTTKVDFYDLYLDYVSKLAPAVSLAINNAYLFDELAKSRDRALFFEKAVQSSSQPFATAHPDGRIMNFNPAFSELLGYSANELKEMDWISGITPPEWRELTKQMLELVRETRRPQVYEKEYLRKDGTRVPVEVTVNQVLDEKENVEYYYLFVRDLALRKRAESELQEAKASLEANVSELEQRNHDIRMLNIMDSLLQASTRRDEANAVAVKSLAQLFAPAAGALYLVEGTGDLLESAAVWGGGVVEENVITPKDCWALRLGRVYSIKDPAAESFCSHVSRDLKTGYMCIPITAQNEMFGLLHLQFPPDWTSPAEIGKKSVLEYKIQLATTAVESMALCFANFHLREILYNQSIRDPLTELFNRRYMREILDKELRRMMRRKRPLSIIMFDLDHFKEFNDRCGHDAGDVLLREISDYTRTHVREEDFACRYGGEEFLIGLPETSLEDARVRAEHLCDAIAHTTIQYMGKSLGPVTISAGVAALPENGTSQDELVRAADKALYQAKEQGRNRVVMADKKQG